MGDFIPHNSGNDIKELKCLYALTDVLDQRSVPLNDLLSRAVDLLPPVWEQSCAICARIRLYGRETLSSNFTAANVFQTAHIVVDGEEVGRVELLREVQPLTANAGRAQKEDGSFLIEFTKRLSAVVERIDAARRLRRAYDSLEMEVAKHHIETGSKNSDSLVADIAMNLMPDSAVVVDRWGKILHFNSQAESLFGYRAEEVVGHDISIFVEKNRRGGHAALLETFMRDPSNRTMGSGVNLTAVKKNGDEFPVDISLSPIGTGDDTRVVAAIRDISAFRQVQLDLIDAKEAAEAATHSKAEFLATMSHEIRTPMNGVIGMIDLLRETQLDDDQQHLVRTARNSAYALLTIINDILDISKIESGKLELEQIPFSIRDVTESTAETLSVAAAGKGVALEVFISPEIPDALRGDAARLRQILFNLIGNAVKFTGEGKVVIRVDPQGLTSEESLVIQIEIQDTGIGMNEDTLSTLFTAFSQADASTSRRYGGTGLGLVITQRLVSMMNAKLDVKSVLGEGTTFTFTITLPIERDHSIQSDGHNLSGLNVLLAAGDTDVRDYLPEYFVHWAAEVDTTNELAEIAEMVKIANGRAKPYDVIVIGCMWPLKEQLELVDTLSAADQTSLGNFVVMTPSRTRNSQSQRDNVVYLEAQPIARARAIRAVAIAAGRASPDIEYAEEDFASQTHNPPTTEEAAANGQLILVAEDNLTNQDVIRRQLAMLGYAADIVDDGKQALAALETQSYAILMTDCHMPEMDGFDLVKTIRSQESSEKRLPIVAITASVLKAEVARCFEAGMDECLAKPLEISKLKMALRTWLPKSLAAPILIDAAEPKEAILTNGLEGSAPIDMSVLKNMFEDDDVCLEILKDFLAPSLSIIEEITTAVSNMSATNVGAAAHKLKSSSRAVGAQALATYCAELETAGKGEDWLVINEKFPQLLIEMKEVTSYIGEL